MIIKIYGLIWLLGALAVGITYLTGNLNPVMVVLFGFLSFGTIFMGMMGVLPSTVTHQSSKNH